MKKFLWAIAALSIAFASCQKSDDVQFKDETIAAAVDGDEVDGMYAEVANEVDQATISAKAGALPDSSGKRTVTTVKNADGTITKTVTFNSWKIGKNQRWVKSGQIIININLSTFTRTVTFNDFTINGKKIEGVKTMVLNPTTGTLTITLKDGKVTFADGTSISHSFTKVWTKVKGAESPLNLWDDEYDITIEASGINRQGKSYTEVTTTPLHLKFTWPVYVSGEVKRLSDDHTIITNYGTGAEDFIVTVTVDGVAKEVNLLDK